jgi:hypothetical protein
VWSTPAAGTTTSQYYYIRTKHSAAWTTSTGLEQASLVRMGGLAGRPASRFLRGGGGGGSEPGKGPPAAPCLSPDTASFAAFFVPAGVVLLPIYWLVEPVRSQERRILHLGLFDIQDVFLIFGPFAGPGYDRVVLAPHGGRVAADYEEGEEHDDGDGELNRSHSHHVRLKVSAHLAQVHIAVEVSNVAAVGVGIRRHDVVIDVEQLPL